MADHSEQQDSPKSIDAKPAHGQSIEHAGQVFTTIKEGLAHILVPAKAVNLLDTKKHQSGQLDPSTKQSVFYNPIQQFNRDLSVLAIRVFSDDVLAVKANKAALARQRKDAKRRPKSEKADPVEKDSQVAQVPVNGPDVLLKRKADDAFAGEPDGHEKVGKPRTEETQDQGEAAFDESPSLAQGSSKDGPGERPKPKPRFSVLDALSATGLRALRYAHEIPAVTRVTANDLSHDAVEAMKVNVTHNCLDDKIKTNEGNAIVHMYQFAGQESNRYDVVDLDPYGTAVPFLDAALNAINDGGLLCVTCTDAGVFASNGYPEKTFALYGGLPIKGNHGHEGGLRLILHSIATAAAKMGIAIEPLLSLSIDFYARVFVRVRRSPAEVKYLVGKSMIVYSCDSGCGAWQLQPLGRNDKFQTKDGREATKHGLAQGPQAKPHCQHCGFKTHVSGPMWGGPLHNPHFLQRILDLLPDLDASTYGTIPRIEGMVSTALEELEVENRDVQDEQTNEPSRPVPQTDPALTDRHPFYFSPSALAGILHCKAPPDAAIKGALRHAGYVATRAHTKPGQVRTNAPWRFVWRVMREWTRQRAPLKEGALKAKTSGFGIMNGGRNELPTADVASDSKTTAGHNSQDKAGRDEDEKEVVFDEQLGREVDDKKRLKRYQVNPRENWGPMSRAKIA